MNAETIAIVTAVIALAIAAYAYYRSGKPLTLQGVTETLEATRPLAEQIRDVAEVVVAGTQQLKETGKIATGDEAFQEAMTHLRAWFPDVEPTRFVPFIEGAYYGLTKLQDARSTKEGDLLDKWLSEEPKS